MTDPLPAAITRALRDVTRAQRAYAQGREDYSAIEIAKIRLANAVLDAVGGGRLARLARIPRATPAAVGPAKTRRRRA